jgi:hypothetical protein
METLRNTAAPFAIRFPALVERLYKDPGNATKGNGIENAIAMQFAAMGTAGSAFKRNAFRNLLLVVFQKKCYGILRNPGYIEVLGNMAAFGNKTVNPANTWVKDSLTAEGQLASLIRHLFAKYEVPAFMEHVFAENNKIHMLWYIQLGRGDSVHNLCGFPAVFTKKMAHAFRETPATLNMEQAIRRAQALGYGANAAVAEAIAWSASLEEITHAGFKAQVISFIAKNAPEVANVAAIQLVVEYAAEMQRADAAYSFKGRTWASVSRLAAEYHVEMAKRLAAEACNGWVPAAIGNYEATDGATTVTITQLTDSGALYNEGEAMSHCVADYEHECAQGHSAIFSLRAFAQGVEVHAIRATLQVFLETTELVQAKAICNQDVSAEAETHILAWAQAEGIAVACELHDNYGPHEYVPPPAPGPLQQVPNLANLRRIVQRPARAERQVYYDGPSRDEIMLVVRIALLLIKLIIAARGCS